MDDPDRCLQFTSWTKENLQGRPGFSDGPD